MLQGLTFYFFSSTHLIYSIKHDYSCMILYVFGGHFVFVLFAATVKFGKSKKNVTKCKIFKLTSRIFIPKTQLDNDKEKCNVNQSKALSVTKEKLLLLLRARHSHLYMLCFTLLRLSHRKMGAHVRDWSFVSPKMTFLHHKWWLPVTGQALSPIYQHMVDFA